MTSRNEMLDLALEMEEKGKNFYEKAFNSCRNPQCKEIFAALAQEEIAHSKRIKQIYETLISGKGWTRDWEKVKGFREDLSLFIQQLGKKEREKITAETSDLEAVDLGVAFESASIKFYEEHRVRATDPLETAFLDQMIREEKGHLKALNDTRYYLTDPEGWFLEKERAGLDGV